MFGHNVVSMCAITLLAATCLSGCGLSVPNMRNLGPDAQLEARDENLVFNHFRCEIREGVRQVVADPRFNPSEGTNAQPPDWMLSWGAKVSYVLTVDEKGQFNPGVSYKNGFAKPLTSFVIGGGVQASSEAQRRETVAVTYAFSDLLREPQLPCNTYQNGILMQGNLKIADFIANKVFIARVPGTTSTGPASIDSSKPQIFNALSDEITFTVTYGASLTPTWTFVRLSVDPTAPLLSATRYKIQYASITMGPVQSPSTKTSAAVLSPQAELLDNANIIGHAIRSALSPGVTSGTLVVP